MRIQMTLGSLAVLALLLLGQGSAMAQDTETPKPASTTHQESSSASEPLAKGNEQDDEEDEGGEAANDNNPEPDQAASGATETETSTGKDASLTSTNDTSKNDTSKTAEATAQSNAPQKTDKEASDTQNTDEAQKPAKEASDNSDHNNTEDTQTPAKEASVNNDTDADEPKPDKEASLAPNKDDAQQPNKQASDNHNPEEKDHDPSSKEGQSDAPPTKEAQSEENKEDDTPDAEANVDNGQKGETVSVRVVSWRDIPFQTVKHQAFDYSCGSAAIATLLTYTYGLPTSEKVVFKEMFAHGDQNKIRREGFSMLDMSLYLNSRGLEAKGFKVTGDALAQYRVPFIALVNNKGYNHFVVVKNETQDHVLVGDPNTGNTDYSKDDFAKIWTGIALIVTNKVSKARLAYNDPKEWHYVRAHASLRYGNDNGTEEAVLPPTDWQIAPVGIDMLPIASIGSVVSMPNGAGGLP